MYRRVVPPRQGGEERLSITGKGCPWLGGIQEKRFGGLESCLDPEKGGGCGATCHGRSEIGVQHGPRKRQKAECHVHPLVEGGWRLPHMGPVWAQHGCCRGGTHWWGCEERDLEKISSTVPH